MELVQSYLRHSVEDVFAELLVFGGDEHHGASEVWKGWDCASDALRNVLFFQRIQIAVLRKYGRVAFAATQRF